MLDRSAPVDLHVFQENHVKTIGNCPFNNGWLKCFGGADFVKPFAKEPVTCSGSTLGTWAGVSRSVAMTTISPRSLSGRGWELRPPPSSPGTST